MIEGQVTSERVPQVFIPVAGRIWPATIDTGFNGALEIHEALRDEVPHRFAGEVVSLLAAGQRVSEDGYRVEFPFDGELVRVLATFSPDDEILIGTRLLRGYRLEVDFPARRVLLERTA